MSRVPTTGETRIVIQMPEGTDGDGSGGESVSPANPQKESNTSKNPAKGDKKSQFKAAAMVQVATSLGTQVVNSAVSNIGLATGNYYLQSRVERGIQATTQMIQLGVSFATNPLAGLATLGGMAVTSYFEQKRQTQEREIANYEAAQYAKKIGYTRGRK